MNVSISKKSFIGYTAGITTGVTYGLNPLFAMPLLMAGAAVNSILFFRYAIAVALLGLFLIMRHENFRVSFNQAAVLLVLGVLFSMSSLLLFEAYNYIPSGLATTLVFLYPVFVAVIMAFLGVRPSWRVCLAIAMSLAGVVVMTHDGESSGGVSIPGILLACGSALAYALFIVFINRSRTISGISNSLLTFYALVVGGCMFSVRAIASGTPLLGGIEGASAWAALVGLAIMPTIVSTATLAVATRDIGATRASVLGVFEPITAILIGTGVFGEPLTPSMLIGILMGVSAVTFMMMSGRNG